MAKSKRSTEHHLFAASVDIGAVKALFENIKVHVVNAEDSMSNGEREAYTTAIEAIAEKGIRDCDRIASLISGTRHG